ncbi:discoidin domain-containing protein [Actinophytocola oryzae]|uniref:F5/8 type C domain-containing protein n=1 Tax=Actinophytocola oryzae TaxID=502181 RepID=A0A4R7W6R7_9PSEU|nr:discoidin domain-containing protein [Actinophytocola oryzae]TDV57858.1 F5/8 type C domain-containing protein [Actinophytocola oryzae]
MTTRRSRALTVIIALAATTVVGTVVGTAPATADEWSDLQGKLAGITGTWTTQDYANSVTTGMPDTALLGNGDVGVISGGGTGFKTFYLSKGDFWNANPSPSTAGLGGVSIRPTGGTSAANLALGATATASSAHESFPASRVVSGGWGAGYEGWVSQVGKPQWVRLDLGSAKTIGRYVIRHDADARPEETANTSRNFEVQTSGNGTDWTTIRSYTNNTAARTDETISAVTTRYVRVNLTTPTQESTSDSTANPRARIGQIELYAPGSTPPPAATFRETQRIADPQIDTDVTIGGAPLTMRTWQGANNAVVVTEVTSNASAATELELSTWAGAGSPRSTYASAAGNDADTLWATRTTATGTRWVSRAAMATEVRGTSLISPSTSGATARARIRLNPGQTVKIVTAVGGGGQNPTNHLSSAQQLVTAQTDATLSTLKSQKTQWWRDFWLKSSVNLGDSTLERYYYGAQYLIGSASRAGKLAPGLYGIWYTTDAPNWSGDMHLNYNFQASFYGVYSSNRADLALPMFQAVRDYLPEAERRAQQDLRRVKSDYVNGRWPSGGLPDGTLFPVGIGPWGTTTDDNYWQQVSNGLFNTSQFIAYWDYTRDVDYLRNTAYPVLREETAFFEQWLQASGTRLDLWGGPHEGTWGRNSGPDLGFVRQLLTTMLEASQVLGVDSGKRAQWQDMLNRLAPIPQTTYNGQNVYALADPGTMVGGDTRVFRPGDNTVNLEFVHPAEGLGLRSPQADRDRAVRTISAMGSWGQENSFPKVFTQAVRVGYDANTVISQLSQQINQKIGPNLRIRDSAHGIEKSGATEAINSMMVQSSQGVIDVFPVWPRNRNASFARLRTRGAFVVSAALSGGTVSGLSIRSDAGGQLRVGNPWSGGVRVTDSAGNTVSSTLSGGVVTVNSTAGQTYTFSQA